MRGVRGVMVRRVMRELAQGSGRDMDTKQAARSKKFEINL